MSSVTFTCPGCEATAHRAQPFPVAGSETFTAPPGHEVKQRDSASWIVCYASGESDWWPVAVPGGTVTG